ncbi:hypothetical protein ACFQZF_09735 [Flavobacterium myungsuense]|uniref:Carboxypeptidase-like regulatory domain-containing protein n=1 Tax=Flavobacterium myungsuense TaxID=651823 RepID=A0ABW3J4U2_9FLAO
MLRNILVLFSIFLSFAVSSQNVEKTILLKDKETNLPIEDATILILKTKQNLLSNSEGKVSFVLKGTSNIEITHTSYTAITIRSTSLKEMETIIYLNNNVNGLDEIILTKRHPQKILSSLIENSKKKLTVPARLKVYSREFFKLNGEYSYYNDGLINFQIYDRVQKANSNILVEQNRSIGLLDNVNTSDLLGYNLNDIMENYYNFKYLNPLLESVAKKEFDFLIKVYSKNKEYNIITAYPNENSKRLSDDFSIIYDPKEKLIIEVSSVISPNELAKTKEKTAIGSKNIYKSLFKTIYKIDNANYYLVSSKEEIGFEKIEKSGTKNIEVRNYFLTTNFSTKNYSFKDSEVFKDKTLYNKKNVVLSDYWNVSGLTATDEEQQIINFIDSRD